MEGRVRWSVVRETPSRYCVVSSSIMATGGWPGTREGGRQMEEAVYRKEEERRKKGRIGKQDRRRVQGASGVPGASSVIVTSPVNKNMTS